MGSRPWSRTPPSGRGFEAGFAAASRGWTPEQWAQAVEDLRDRAVLAADGSLADRGAALREQLEEATDVASAAPLDVLTGAEVERLTGLARSLSGRALAAGAFPPGVFARPAR